MHRRGAVCCILGSSSSLFCCLQNFASSSLSLRQSRQPSMQFLSILLPLFGGSEELSSVDELVCVTQLTWLDFLPGTAGEPNTQMQDDERPMLLQATTIARRARYCEYSRVSSQLWVPVGLRKLIEPHLHVHGRQPPKKQRNRHCFSLQDRRHPVPSAFQQCLLGHCLQQ